MQEMSSHGPNNEWNKKVSPPSFSGGPLDGEVIAEK